MTTKSILQILPPPPPHMVGDGFRVHNFFPSGYNLGKWSMSPFFLLDYNSKVSFTPRENPRGVGVHPHRGFETVTIAFHGKVAHHDSAGNSGIIEDGDVQWMTAASGILHKEYHEQEFSRSGGLFQMVQLWVNLPAKHKMSPPKYQAIKNSMMGKYVLPANNGSVDIVAGTFKGIKGPAFTFTPIEMYIISLKKDATLAFSLPENYNTGLLILDGNVKFNHEEEANEDTFTVFQKDGDEINLEAINDCKILVISGEPINEPIKAYGPFLMNTNEEIVEAMNDFAQGKFGKLED